MRVLHVIPSLSKQTGGPAQAVVSMCNALQASGIEVALAATNAGLSETEIDLGVPTSYRGVKTLVFPVQSGHSFQYSHPLATWLDAHVNDFDIVHIHAVFNHACVAAARACRKNRVPYIMRPLGSLDPWSMRQKRLRKTIFWKLVGKRMLANAAAVHYTATGEQRNTEGSLGLNHGRVIPQGVETAPSLDSIEESESSQQPYILVLSRFHPGKGLEILLDAFLSLVKEVEFSAWRLVLAGDGPAGYVRKLKRKVSNSNCDTSVSFPGWIEGAEKEALLSNAALLALPSFHENFGLCVMEALARGVPVLISPHVDLAPDVEAAGAGWIAEVETAPLRATLTEALRSKPERIRRGQLGRKLSERFTWPLIAKQLGDLYTAVLNPS